MKIHHPFLKSAVALALLASIGACQSTQDKATAGNTATPVLEGYANIALDNYSDSLVDAKTLQSSIANFSKSPTAKGLKQAKVDWLNSRESYGQTEVYRLSNGPIDAEEGWIAEAYGALEGQMNAWPLDENMVDYTIDEKGQRTSGNIIDGSGMFNPGGEEPKPVDITTITVEAITELNENGGEANVATGYHAIEFLLWGQDQDYTNFQADTITPGPMTAGQRPLSDFTKDKFAKRRLAYLQASADKLVQDLTVVSGAWSKKTSSDCGKDATGCYRAALLGQLQGKDAAKNIPSDTALKQIIAGMGVFIKSELANERIAVAVLTPSEEDEHSCFSDNTHRDIVTNYDGFINVLKANYKGKSYGDSLYAKSSADTRAAIDALTASIEPKVKNVDELARTKWHFDHQILPGNNAKEIRKMKNEMRKLGDTMILVAADMGVSLTADDVTDPEETKL